MLPDHAKRLTTELRIPIGPDQVARRATFIVDPDGIVRWVNLNDLDAGRIIGETIRGLDALQTVELCHLRGAAVLCIFRPHFIEKPWKKRGQ
jgi:alkyl hydroperoxide reductase subunit AhpC